jgi:hypothetical protein
MRHPSFVIPDKGDVGMVGDEGMMVDGRWLMVDG